MSLIKYQMNLNKKEYNEGTNLALFNAQSSQEVINFHRKFANYQETPLRNLSFLAQKLNLASINVKDEAKRFGLNAFKGLGGSYAVGKFLAEMLELDINTLTFEKLREPSIQGKIKHITFITATDGNHGRGIAWAAQQVGLKAIVYMPKGSSTIRAENIKQHGAECTITDLNYDDTVRLANKAATDNGWFLLQDTAWEGYEKIPTWIMQGYMTLAVETYEQLKGADLPLPTHIILQAGVGSFAGSMIGAFMNLIGEDAPKFIIVEPHQANCLYLSSTINDGAPHAVEGDLATLMAGLACGEPSSSIWPVIQDYADCFISADDQLSANGMRIAIAPRPETDQPFISGESGAIGIGLLHELMTNPSHQALLNHLNINNQSHVLLISTEGDTSPDVYEQVIWEGKNKL